MSEANKEVHARLGSPTVAELKAELKFPFNDLYAGLLLCLVATTLKQCPDWKCEVRRALSNGIIQRDLQARGISSARIPSFTIERNIIHAPCALLALCL